MGEWSDRYAREDPTGWVLAEILARRAAEHPDRPSLKYGERPWMGFGEVERARVAAAILACLASSSAAAAPTVLAGWPVPAPASALLPGPDAGVVTVASVTAAHTAEVLAAFRPDASRLWGVDAEASIGRRLARRHLSIPRHLPPTRPAPPARPARSGSPTPLRRRRARGARTGLATG